MLNQSTCDIQQQLKIALQEKGKHGSFEKLAATMLSKLMEVPIYMASSGFQCGADAGTSGSHGRWLRLECKKYQDTTSLSVRELQGELRQAITQSPDLEAWILAVTHTVKEQITTPLVADGIEYGVPVIVWDWRDETLAPLAALCATFPDCVEQTYSREAADLARQLPIAEVNEEIGKIRKELQSWTLGYDITRSQSLAYMQSIWNSPTESKAKLGQNVAGGAIPQKLLRESIHAGLNNWWDQAGSPIGPGVMVGLEGTGKTWAALSWLIERQSDLPIVMIISSSVAANLGQISGNEVKRLLAIQLFELTKIRDTQHWAKRLERMLNRPVAEGPVMLVIFDGMNQEPSLKWLDLMQVFQGAEFNGRVRIIVSTRPDHYSDKLNKLRGLEYPPIEIPVKDFNAEPNGELDQMLAMHMVKREDLHPDLVKFACNPRMFQLVIRFRERLRNADEVTPHRLLWEYGRDTFGERVGKSFTESEWQEWLHDIALELRQGVTRFSRKQLKTMLDQHDLEPNQIYARLSELIDSGIGLSQSSQQFQPQPLFIAHALGAATLRTLMELDNDTFDRIDAKLALWLDPVSGFDQRAEILRAAVSIAIEHEPPPPENVVAVLVSAWLRTQNLPDEHRLEVVNLGSSLVTALLSAIEHAHPHTQRSVRKWAIEALREIDRANVNAMNIIMQRAETWCRNLTVNDQLVLSSGDDEHRKRRADGFVKRMGSATPGNHRVLGRDFLLLEQEDFDLTESITEILDGFPLATAMPVFESITLAKTLNRGISGWEEFKWLILLNQVDNLATANALRQSAQTINDMVCETMVNPAIPVNCAAILLELSGAQADEVSAEKKYVSIDDNWHTYENTYLPNPNRSFWRLERRHAQAFLVDNTIAIRPRLQRAKTILVDPTFELPEQYINTLVNEAKCCDTSKLATILQITTEDYNFQELQIGLARCAPDVLAQLIRSKIQTFRSRTGQARYAGAINSDQYLILVGNAEQAAANSMRTRIENDPEWHEAFIGTHLLYLELSGKTAFEQARLYLAANLPWVERRAIYLLRPLSADEADLLLDQYENTSKGQANILLSLFNTDGFQPSERVWNWMLKIALDNDSPMRGLAFENLTFIAAERFGLALMENSWRWEAAFDELINHYGSEALIAAMGQRPFEDLVDRIGPAKLLKAVRTRGANPIEVLIVANLFTNMFHATETVDIDLRSILTVNQNRVRAGTFEMSSSNLDIPEEDFNNPDFIDGQIGAQAHADKCNAAMRLAESRIRQARIAGAKVLMEKVSVEDVMLVVDHAPAVLDQWLDGMEQNTRSFRHRAHLSHSVFYSLCEAMLVRDMARGVTFWHRLYENECTGGMRITGRLDIRELIHMPFKMADTENAHQLRAELLDLRNCNTDLDLFNLTLCANRHQKQQWLDNVIAADEASPLPWQQKRAMVLKGFAVGNCLPIANAWPEAELRTSYDRLAHQAAQWQTREACARHWWRTFLGCETVEAAYAAWIMLLETTDRRTWIWFDEDIRELKSNSPHFDLKNQHVNLNMDALKKAMAENEKDLKEKFLNLKIGKNVFPWRREATFD